MFIYLWIASPFSYASLLGQVEEQVNHFKTINHQMYSRASFGLLRQRVFGRPRCFHTKCEGT